MGNKLSLKDRRREHPMFDSNDYCVKCKEVVPPAEGLSEEGQCRKCENKMLTNGVE